MVMGREGKSCPKADGICSQGLCYRKYHLLDKLSSYKWQNHTCNMYSDSLLLHPHHSKETIGEARHATRSSLTET